MTDNGSESSAEYLCAMPTTVQIENADPLTADQAINLIAALRGSALYSLNRHLYPDVDDLVTAQIAQATALSRLLSSVHDVVFRDGLSTVAISGSKDGVNYSAERDREEELTLALDALIDRPVGATTLGPSATGSFNLNNQDVF
jgi:hypothetical protein